MLVLILKLPSGLMKLYNFVNKEEDEDDYIDFVFQLLFKFLESEFGCRVLFYWLCLL